MSSMKLTAALLATTLLTLPAQAVTIPEGTQLAEDQTITWRALDEYDSLDPQVMEGVDSSNIAKQLFEGLTLQDAQGETIPGVAEEWTANEDSTEFTFKLREDSVWSDGMPVTAGDFVYAWRRLADPELASNYQWYLQLMKVKNADAIVAGEMPTEELGVEAVDEHTLKVTLSESVPFFPIMTTHTSTFPTPAQAIEVYEAEWTKPGNMVSNGAYTLVEHAPNERIVLKKSDSYWDAENVVMDTFVGLIIQDENQGLTRFLAGEVDVTDIPAGQYPRLHKEMPEVAVSTPRLCNYYFNFNLRENGPEAFKDERVRRALALTVDRKIIAENILAAGQTEAWTFTPPLTAGFTAPEIPMAAMTQAERDEKAKMLMEEAGYGADNPLKFSYLYNTDEAHKKIAVAIQQMWKQKLGVEVSLENSEWKTFLNARDEGDFDMARGAWCGDYNEPSTFLGLLTTDSGHNDAKYSSEEFDALLANALTSDDSEAEYTKAEALLDRDMPVIQVYHYAEDKMIAPTLKGWPMENIEQNWYVKDMYKVAE